MPCLKFYVGEECDCGVDEPHCRERGEFDSCHPKNAGQKLGCKLKNDVECSHPSSGPCCNQQNQFVPKSQDLCCSNCADSNECRLRSHCNGTSATCPEPEPKEDLKSTCNEKTQVCWKGECMKSICEHPEINAKECSLPFSSNPTKIERRQQCQIACNVSGRPCMSLESLKKEASEGSSILMDLTQLQMTPGSSCNTGKGFCDALSRCRDLDPEGALQSLVKLVFNQGTATSILEFLIEKWYIAVGSVIGFIVIMAGFIRCFSVHTPTSNPRLPAAYDIGGTLRRPHRTLRRMASRDAYGDEPPPAYNDLYNERGAPRQTGIEMSNRGTRQYEMQVTSRASRHPTQGGNQARR